MVDQLDVTIQHCMVPYWETQFERVLLWFLPIGSGNIAEGHKKLKGSASTKGEW